MSKPAALCLALLPAIGLAQERPVPYAGQEVRAIKALSQDEIESYRAGQGMGLAKAAELNHYPGPKHVLELAQALGLTNSQRAVAEGIYKKMHESAVRLGAAVVAREAELDRLFGRGEIDAAGLEAAVTEIARLQGQVRAAHLLAHLEMKPVLTAEQLARYDRLRGYGSATHDHNAH